MNDNDPSLNYEWNELLIRCARYPEWAARYILELQQLAADALLTRPMPMIIQLGHNELETAWQSGYECGLIGKFGVDNPYKLPKK